MGQQANKQLTILGITHSPSPFNQQMTSDVTVPSSQSTPQSGPTQNSLIWPSLPNAQTLLSPAALAWPRISSHSAAQKNGKGTRWVLSGRTGPSQSGSVPEVRGVSYEMAAERYARESHGAAWSEQVTVLLGTSAHSCSPPPPRFSRTQTVLFPVLGTESCLPWLLGEKSFRCRLHTQRCKRKRDR